MRSYARWIDLRRRADRLRYAAVLALSCTALMLSPSARAQEVEEPARPGEIYVLHQARAEAPVLDRGDIRQRVDTLWRQRKEEVRDTGAADPGPQSLEPILESLGQQGYRSATGLESNLVHEAYRLKELKFLEQAHRSLESALALDPKHIPTLSARAEISLGRRPMNAPGQVFTAITSIPDSFWPALTTLVDLVLILAFTLLVISFLLHLTIAARYQKLFRHSFIESWRERMPADFLPVASWCLFLGPLFIFLGPYWLFCYWTAVLWRFTSRAERLLAVVSLLVLALFIPAVDTVEGTYRDLDTADLRLFSDALKQKLLSPRGEALIGVEPADRDAPDITGFGHERRFLVADIDRRMGRDEDAFSGYTSMPVQHYLYPMAQNNIGNIYFAMHQFDLSIQHYRQALDIRPDYAECWFNLSNAQFQVYDFDHSDQSLSRAQRLAPLVIGKLINGEPRGLRTLDHRIPESFLWELTWKTLRRNAAQHFAGLGLIVPGGRLPAQGGGILVFPAAALLAALIGMLLGWFHRHEEIGRCSSCGRAYCRHCGPDPRKQPHCQQCTQLDSRMSGVAPEIQKKKISQIRLHQLWARLREGLLAITIPGLERVRRGRTVSGLLVAGLWVFLVTLVLAIPRFLHWTELQAPPWSLNPLVLVAGILASLLWVSSLSGWLVRVVRTGGWRLMGTLRLAHGHTKAKTVEGEI